MSSSDSGGEPDGGGASMGQVIMENAANFTHHRKYHSHSIHSRSHATWSSNSPVAAMQRANTEMAATPTLQQGGFDASHAPVHNSDDGASSTDARLDPVADSNIGARSPARSRERGGGVVAHRRRGVGELDEEVRGVAARHLLVGGLHARRLVALLGLPAVGHALALRLALLNCSRRAARSLQTNME